MKVDSKNIAQAFVEIKALLAGIDDIFRDGEYVEECINSIGKDITSIINVFTIEHMTPKAAAVDKRPTFIKRYDELIDKAEMGINGPGLTPTENGEIFMARFYLFLKRELPKHEIPFKGKPGEIEDFIYYNIVLGTTYEGYFISEFDRQANTVLRIVEKEILEHRRRFPQMQLDLEIKNPIKSNNLIDIL